MIQLNNESSVAEESSIIWWCPGISFTSNCRSIDSSTINSEASSLGFDRS